MLNSKSFPSHFLNFRQVITIKMYLLHFFFASVNCPHTQCAFRFMAFVLSWMSSGLWTINKKYINSFSCNFKTKVTHKALANFLSCTSLQLVLFLCVYTYLFYVFQGSEAIMIWNGMESRGASLCFLMFRFG